MPTVRGGPLLWVSFARPVEVDDGLVRLGQQLEELRRDPRLFNPVISAPASINACAPGEATCSRNVVGDQLSSSGQTSATVGSVSVSRIRVVARGEGSFPKLFGQEIIGRPTKPSRFSNNRDPPSACPDADSFDARTTKL